MKGRHVGVTSALIVAAATIFSCGSASNSPAEPWPPKELAEKLQAEPKTEVDKKIKQAIDVPPLIINIDIR